MLDAAMAAALLPIAKVVPARVRLFVQVCDCKGRLRRRAYVVPGQAAGVGLAATNSLATGVVMGIDNEWLEVNRAVMLTDSIAGPWMEVGSQSPSARGDPIFLSAPVSFPGEVESVLVSFELSD